jgi:hypothetical protein
MLKQLQGELNESTRELHRRTAAAARDKQKRREAAPTREHELGDSAAREQELAEAAALGQRQQEIRELAARMMQKAGAQEP